MTIKPQTTTFRLATTDRVPVRVKLLNELRTAKRQTLRTRWSQESCSDLADVVVVNQLFAFFVRKSAVEHTMRNTRLLELGSIRSQTSVDEVTEDQSLGPGVL